MALPEKTEAEREAILDQVFEHFGICSADFLASRTWTKESLADSVEVVGMHHLDQGLEAGKGVLVITGHLGNWERITVWSGFNGYPLHVVARAADDEGVERLVYDLRTRSGTKVIPRGDAARPILQALRQNEIVGILPDQNSHEVFIPFFGHLAGTVLGPGVLHERTGAAVIPVAAIRIGVGRYRLTIYPPLVAEAGGEKGEGMMRAIHAWLEQVIREHPEQWLWFHDRWRNARERGLL